MIFYQKVNIVCLPTCSRFPEDALYFSEGSWRLIRIGEGPLGFGKPRDTAIFLPPTTHGTPLPYTVRPSHYVTPIVTKKTHNSIKFTHLRPTPRCICITLLYNRLSSSCRGQRSCIGALKAFHRFVWQVNSMWVAVSLMRYRSLQHPLPFFLNSLMSRGIFV